MKYSHYFPLLSRRVGLIEIDKRNGVAYPHGTSFYPADGYSSHVIVVVYGRNKHLKGSLLVDRLRLEMIDYCFKQGLQIGSLFAEILRCGSVAPGTVYYRTHKLRFVCVEFKQQIENFVFHLVESCVQSVRLVYDKYQLVPQFERLLHNEPRLRHGSLRRIDQHQNAVYHFKHTLHFSSEVRVPRRVHNIDFSVLVINRRVFCKYGYTAFAFKVVGVHHPVGYALIFSEYTALFEHFVDQRRLAVVYVGYDCYVSQIFSDFQNILP